MALGEPPRSGLSSFRLLFVIVREPPPRLDPPFSPQLRDFVAQCLDKSPGDRPSAIDLLMHPFVAAAQRPTDMPARIAAFLATRKPPGAARGDARRHMGTVVSKAEGVEASAAAGNLDGGWDFGTVRAALPREGAGSVRQHAAATAGRHIQVPDSPGSPGLASACASSRPAPPPSPFQRTQQAKPAAPQPALSAEPLRHSFAAPKARTPSPGSAAPVAPATGPVAAALARLHAAVPAAAPAALADALELLSPAGGPAVASGAGGKEAPAGALPDLGPLGSLLLARWEEGAGRERAAA
jgi:hypothetical protein